MPDFDKNLNPIIKQSSNLPFDITVAPAKKPNVLISPLGKQSDLAQEQDAFAELKSAQQASIFDKKGILIPNSVLDENRRYKTFNPTVSNYEDFAAYGQSNLDKAANGLLKGAELAASTFAGGFGTIYGAGKAILPGGKLSDIWDNPVLNELSVINEKVDKELLPNYYTDAEKNAAWYSTDNWFTSNFLFDKLIKNSGYAVGAMYSGNLANVGLLATGAKLGSLAAKGAALAEASQAFKLFTPLLRNTARAFSYGKNVEAAGILEKQISSIADLTTKSSELGKITTQTNLFNKVGDVGRRTAIALYSSAGEASFEALATSKEFRKNLIEQYTNEHGYEPTGDDLKTINETSESVGKTSFLGNMALLSATEYVQLPYLMGSSYSATKQVANSIAGKVDDVILKDGKYIAKEPTTLFGKVSSKVWNTSSYGFDLKESGQEIGQYALQVGTQNYFNKAYRSKDADVWVNGVLHGFTGEDERGNKIGALNSKEGLESGLLGGITGGLMQAKSNFKQSRQTSRNTVDFLNELNNSHSFKEAFQDRLNSVNRSIVLQKQHQDAVVGNDKLEALDLKNDIFHNYMYTRVKYGRYDMVMADLNDIKQEAATEEGLAALKQAGYANINDTVSSFTERVTELENSTKSLNELSKSINLRYGGVTDKEGNRKYSPIIIDKLVYSASKIENYDKRIPQVNNSLLLAGVDTLSVLESIIKDNKPSKESTELALEKINSLNTSTESKIDLKSDLSDVIELSLRRKMFMDEYEDIKSNPKQYEAEVEFGTSEDLPISVKQQVLTNKGRKITVDRDVEIGKEYSLAEPLRKEGTSLSLFPKIAVLSQTLGGEYEVKLPNGSTAFLTPQEFKQYSLYEASVESPKLQEILDKVIETVLHKKEHKGITLPEKPTLEDINYLSNEKLAKDIQNEFYKKAKEQIKKDIEDRQKAELLLKQKDQLKKTQDLINGLSDETPTGDTEDDKKIVDGWEDMKKSFLKLFTSTTTASEWQKVLAPSILRFNDFVNNFKNFKNKGNVRTIIITENQERALGLDGLAKLSFEQGGLDVSTTKDSLNGFVAAVFVQINKDGSKSFIDKDGNEIGKVGEKTDLSKVVFSTMPGVNLFYSKKNDKGELIPRYRSSEKEESTQQAAAYTIYREKLFASSPEEYSIYEFGISKGIPNIAEQPENNFVGTTLVDEKQIATVNLIEISKKGTIAHEDGNNYKFAPGRPVFKNADDLTYLNNSKISKDKATTIFEVIKRWSDEVNASIASGDTVVVPTKYLEYLNNILYTNSKTPVKGNTLYLDADTGLLHIGKKVDGQVVETTYDFANIANFKDQVINDLQSSYHNVNSKTLAKGLGEKFLDFYTDDKGALKERVWPNYQSYLLASKTPDGSNRNIEDAPLYTNISKPTEVQPQPFKQKYVFIPTLGMQFPEYKPQQKKKEEPTVTSDIEAKKADIERRRQEDIKQLDYDYDNYQRSKSTGEYKKFIDQINAKYDAELASLEEQKPTKTEGYVLDGNTVNTYPFKLSNGSVVGIEFTSKDGNIELVDGPINIKAFTEIGLDETQIEEWEKNAKEKNLKVSDKLIPILVNLKIKKEIFSQKAPIATPAKVEVQFTNEGEVKPIKLSLKKTTSKTRLSVKGKKVQRISDTEISLFKEWAAKNIPNIPYEFVEHLLNSTENEKAWGLFEDGIAKIFKKGERGTEYHEVFHAVWDAFVPEDQKEQILNEVRNRKGSFVDRKGKKVDYNATTDLQVEEKLADEFAEFRLGKLPVRSLGDFVRQAFRALVEFVKKFYKGNKLTNSLFKAIDTGEFKLAVYPENYSPITKNSAVVGLTTQQTHDFVQDITARLFQEVFNNEKSLFNISDIFPAKIFNEIKEIYKEAGMFDQVPEETFEQLVDKTKEYLRQFNIEFDEDSKLIINDDGVNSRDYAAEAFSVNFKKSSPYAVKLLLSTLVRTEKTNQENSSVVKLPDFDTTQSSIGGMQLVPFGQTFNALINHLSNVRDPYVFVDKLFNLAKKNSDYLRLFTRLGGDISTGKINFDNYQAHNWRLFIQFYQVFTKQKPEGLVQYNNGENIYTASANQASSAKQIQREWVENMKILSEKTGIIRYSKTKKTYSVNRESQEYKDLKINSPQEQVDFLNKIGIPFTLSVFNSLSKTQLEKFANAVSGIKTSLDKTGVITSLKGKELDIAGHLNKLAEVYVSVNQPNTESTFFNTLGKQQQAFTDANAPSFLEYAFNSSSTLKELKENFPGLNDVFSTSSEVLKLGGRFFNEEGERIAELKVSYILGPKDTLKNKGKAISELNKGERTTIEINQNLNDNYYILLPGDSSTEWMLNLGNSISYGAPLSEVSAIFKRYLLDDILTAQDYKNREKTFYIGGKAKELRFFKDLLPESLLNKINTLVDRQAPASEINDFINSPEVTTVVEESLQNWFTSMVNKTKQDLLYTRELIINTEGNYEYSGLENNVISKLGLDKNNLTEEQLNNLLFYLNTNYSINNIEYHKILFGDPYQFKIVDKNNKVILDETKRIKSYLSPRRITVNFKELNDFLNKEYNRVGEVVLTDKDYGYHLNKDYAKTFTAKDVEVEGTLLGKTNEADAASWIMDVVYKEVKFKNGQWSDEAEAFHQWQMAYTRKNIPGYKYSSKQLEKQDEALLKTPIPSYVIEVLKPIVSGNKANQNRINGVLDKDSQMPLYYQAIQGTNLEKLYIKMFNEGYDYAIMESGRKEGAESKENGESAFHSLYKDGNFNEEPFNNTVNVPWESYGIQVENSYDKEKTQTRGSQLTKLATLDLFSDGEPIGETPERQETIRKEVEHHNHIFDMMHENGYQEILNKLSIEDNGESFDVIDDSTVAETLRQEMLKRVMSENAIDSISINPKTGKFYIPFEASSNYKQIKDILYSVVAKSLNSPKLNGFPAVQVPVTMWENSKEGRKTIEINGKKVLTDSTLKFYEDEDGKRYCEILLPNWVKKKFNFEKFPTDESILKYLSSVDEGEILKGIGFRIPTQALSSVENFKVKGFIPEFMGRTVVVPSEITTKAGSDFDIDKLNLYLKSVYVDENGDVKVVKYKGSEQATKDFYTNVYEKTYQKRITKIENSDQFRDEVLNILNKLEAAEGENIQDNVDKLSDKEYSFWQNHSEVFGNIEDQAVQQDISPREYFLTHLDKVFNAKKQNQAKLLNDQLKKDFVDRMYKKSLENEYYMSLDRILSFPENFKRLTSPNTDVELAKIADELTSLMGENDTKVKNKLLDRNYMSALRHAFITGKRWVGRAAVNITSHSTYQKDKMYVKDQHTDIILPHNTVNIDGKDHISLSGIFDKAGKYISDKLSMYANSFVDVVKDPYILKVIYSDRLVSTFMFLERAGVPMKHTALFMNQPIVREYISYLDSIRASPWNIKNDEHISVIKDMFPTTVDSLATKINSSISNLSQNIKDYYQGKLTKEQNAEQLYILDEFFKYYELADANFKIALATNFDTANIKNIEELNRKQLILDLTEKANPISSPKKLLAATHIGRQSDIIDRATDALGAILKFNRPEFREVLQKVIAPYAKNQYLSKDNFRRVSEKLSASFLDYIILTKLPGLNIQDLVVDADNVALQVLEMKKTHPEIKMLQDLVVQSDRQDGAKTLKLRANTKDAYDENMYIGYMREMRDNPGTASLYKDLVKVAIIQGTYQSSVSLKNIVPIEDYSKLVAPLISNLTIDKTITIFAENNMFQKNNWKDDIIVPQITPKFYSDEDGYLGTDMYYNDVYQYTTKAFLEIPQIASIKGREVFTLHPMAKGSQYPVIVIPKILKIQGEMVDFKTGQTITKGEYAERKQRGEQMNILYGYQKVVDVDASPLKTSKGYFIYKQTNLLGDGQYAQEYYQYSQPSVMDNSTEKVGEIPDNQIVNYFQPAEAILPETPARDNDSESTIPPCSK